MNHLIMNCIARFIFDALNRKNNSISIYCAFLTKEWSQDDFETSIFSANFDYKLFFWYFIYFLGVQNCKHCMRYKSGGSLFDLAPGHFP